MKVVEYRTYQWSHMTRQEFQNKVRKTLMEFLNHNKIHAAIIWDKNGASLAFGDDTDDYRRFLEIIHNDADLVKVFKL